MPRKGRGMNGPRKHRDAMSAIWYGEAVPRYIVGANCTLSLDSRHVIPRR